MIKRDLIHENGMVDDIHSGAGKAYLFLACI